MAEPSTSPAPPLRTWRPMAAWTAGILLAWTVSGGLSSPIQIGPALCSEGGTSIIDVRANRVYGPTIRAKVTGAEDGGGGGKTVTISAGRTAGVHEGMEFTCKAKGWTGKVLAVTDTSATLTASAEVAVGDEVEGQPPPITTEEFLRQSMERGGLIDLERHVHQRQSDSSPIWFYLVPVVLLLAVISLPGIRWYRRRHLQQAYRLARQGNYSGAIVLCREAVHRRPGDAEARVLLGFLLGKTGDLDRAIVEYSEALRLDPDCADTYDRLGHLLGLKGQHAGAIDAYRSAIALDPKDQDLHYNLGCELWRHGKMAEARDEFFEALRLWPEFTAAASALKKIRGEEAKP